MRSVVDFVLKYHIDHILSLLIIAFWLILRVVDILKQNDFIKNVLYNILQIIIWGIIGYFRQIWFWLCFISAFCYCRSHDFGNIELLPITGKSLILCLFIFLVIYPFISNFKIPGIEGQFYDIFNAETASKKIDQCIANVKNKSNKTENSELAKLVEELNNVMSSNNEGGKNV